MDPILKHYQNPKRKRETKEIKTRIKKRTCQLCDTVIGVDFILYIAGLIKITKIKSAILFHSGHAQ